MRTFSQAVELILEGKHVHRVGYKKQYYLSRDKKKIMEQYADGCVNHAMFFSGDVLSNEWEIVH